MLGDGNFCHKSRLIHKPRQVSEQPMKQLDYPVVSRLFPYYGVTCKISFGCYDDGMIRGFIAIPFDEPVYRFSFTSSIVYNKFKKKVLEFSDTEIQNYVDKIIKSNKTDGQPGFLELKDVIIPFLQIRRYTCQ